MLKRQNSGPSYISWEESQLLEEPDQGEMFVGSRKELALSVQTFSSLAKTQQCVSGRSQSPGVGTGISVLEKATVCSRDLRYCFAKENRKIPGKSVSRAYGSFSTVHVRCVQ